MQIQRTQPLVNTLNERSRIITLVVRVLISVTFGTYTLSLVLYFRISIFKDLPFRKVRICKQIPSYYLFLFLVNARVIFITLPYFFFSIITFMPRKSPINYTGLWECETHFEALHCKRPASYDTYYAFLSMLENNHDRTEILRHRRDMLFSTFWSNKHFSLYYNCACGWTLYLQ